jgi:hypothetical protein
MPRARSLRGVIAAGTEGRAVRVRGLTKAYAGNQRWTVVNPILTIYGCFNVL